MFHCVHTYEYDAATFFLRSSPIRYSSHTISVDSIILTMTYAEVVEPFTVQDNIRSKVDSMVYEFHKKMNVVQKNMYEYSNAGNDDEKKKKTTRKELQDSWQDASAIIQELREMQDLLTDKENEAVHSFEMNDGIWKHGKTLSNLDSHLAERQMRLDSARKLALQSEEQQRRQVTVKWMYVILFILLLGGTVYMYMWVVGDEVGIHNAKSYNEAIEAPPASQSNSDESSKSIMQKFKDSFMEDDHDDHDDEHHDDDYHDDYHDDHDDDHHDDFMSNFFSQEPTNKPDAVNTSEAPSSDK